MDMKIELYDIVREVAAKHDRPKQDCLMQMIELRRYYSTEYIVENYLKNSSDGYKGDNKHGSN